MKKFTKTKLGAFILLFFTLLFVCCGHYSEENLNVLGQIFKEIEIQNERINEQNEDLHNTIANYAKVREGRWIGHDRTAKEIRKKSAVFFDRIQEIKRTITAHLMIDDPSLEKFSEMDQGEKLDLIFFNASGLTIEGKEFLELMNNYRIRVIQVFASQYPEYTEVVEERFFVGDFEGNGLNSNNQSQSWLSHNFKNQPLIASLAKLTLIQNNIRLVEWDVSNALYSNTLLLYFGYKVDEKTYLLPESSVEEFLLTYPEAKRLDYDSIINSTILGVDAIYLDDSTNILIVVVILFILVIIYINRKKKTPVSKPIEKKKSSDSGPLLFKASIEGFIEKMKEIPDWYQIIQARGNGHAMMVDIGIKVDDYEYWANAHKEEYMIKHDNGDLDVEGINLRIEKFRFIATELEKVIKRASELSLNITTEMANDYHAARASVLGAEKALKEMNDESEDKVIEIEEKQIKNKFCTNCGTPSLGNNKFCASCGNKLI